MIRLFGHAPADPSATIRPVERELALEPMSVDEAFVVECNGEKWVEHFESELVISRDDMRRILRRATLLSFRENAPVWTTVILMSKRHAPAKEVAELIEEERGGLTVSLRLRVRKMWETPASEILDGPAVIEAVPLVGGMKASSAEIEEATRRLEAVTDKQLRSGLGAEFAIWAGLNCGKINVEQIRARLRMVTAKDLWLASPVGQEVLTLGRQEGRQEGLATAREQLAILAGSRFPGLLDPERIAKLDLPALSGLFRALASAKDSAEAAEAISHLPL